MSAVEDASGTAMTVKEMVTELYGDMKAVRPMVEKLDGQNLDARVRDLEAVALRLAALAPSTLKALELSTESVTTLMRDRVTRDERVAIIKRASGASNRLIIIVLGVGELIIGYLALVNHASVIH